MFKLTLLLIVLASSILLVGYATSSPVEGRIAAYQKPAKPAPDCGGKRKPPCNRPAPSANEEKGERSSKAGSKVLFDRTVF